MGTTERQRLFRERMAAKGIVPVTIWLPKGHAIGDIKHAAARIVEEPHLSVRLIDTRTGRVVPREKRRAPIAEVVA